MGHGQGAERAGPAVPTAAVPGSFGLGLEPGGLFGGRRDPLLPPGSSESFPRRGRGG